MLDLAAPAGEAIWRRGRLRLLVAAVEFPDAAAALPASWPPRMIAEMDAYFREASGGAIRWTGAGVRRVRMNRPSPDYRLRRRTLRDRVRFWRTLAGRLAGADAILAVVPDEAAVRGCFAVGPRWNSPRLDAALRLLDPGASRGAVVRASTPWGTVAHELGHVVGLPDLYDYRAARLANDLSASRYVGPWDLMGRSPEDLLGARPHPMAWTRSLAGWTAPAEWSPGRARYRIGPGEEQAAVRIPLGAGRSLFVEARVWAGFDAVLPSEGVLLSVADDRIAEGRGPLRVVDPPRPRDSDRETRLGPHWNAALAPGETHTCLGHAVRVLDRDGDAFTVEIVSS